MFLAMLIPSCSSVQEQRRNAELVVTYEGKEVHRASPIYSSQRDLETLVDSKEKKYIIFSAEWCSSCKGLIKALKNTNYLEKVVVLNLDELWAARLFQAAELSAVPSMLVADEEGKPEGVVSGPAQIMMYLFMHIKKD